MKLNSNWKGFDWDMSTVMGIWGCSRYLRSCHCSILIARGCEYSA